MTEFHYATDTEGVATITWDVPGKSMNVMSREGFQELEACIDRALSDPAVKGVVITSGKPDFAGGMDLNVLARIREEAGENPAQGLFEWLMSAHRLLRKIERGGADPKTMKGGKPVAAALPGTAMGIGLELALACHRIFAADNPKARIGLPEIKVGLFPGGGGTTRLAWKLGAMAAAPWLLEGRTEEPRKVQAAGIIDEVLPPEELLSRARAWVLSAKPDDIVKPWDKKGYKIPGGTPYHPAGFQTFVGASVLVHANTWGVYPAAKALLSAVYEGMLVPFDVALRIEARRFVQVLLNPSSTAMIRSLFINKQALEKGLRRPAAVSDQRVTKLGVLGAGMMGGGIAFVSAKAGMEVVLIDTTQELAERGKGYSQRILDQDVAKKKISAEERDAVLARITPTTDFAKLEGCDLVIEAVFEDPAIKAEVTRKAVAVIPETAIFASNTSTLPITELAKASNRPEQFIGIHFFSPVEKMLLVEIIRGKQTGEQAVAKALDYVRQIRKTPIVVNDARFFYANRCIIPYINEGLRMLTEGVKQPLVDHAARLLGFPVGPLQLIDETSLDLAARIARATKAALGDAYPDSDVDALVFWMNDLGRLGRKAKAGFFDYDANGTRRGYWKGLTERFPHKAEQPPLDEVKNRLMLVQVIEAVKALEDGVLTDIREGDVGAILGWGFAPWSGGPFSWIDMQGPAQVVALCDDYAARFGPRFAAPKLLRELAAQGGRFYAGTEPARAAA